MTLQEELKALKERIAELEEQAKREYEFPQDGDNYWYINSLGIIMRDKWSGFVSEGYMTEIGNVFQTEQQAQFTAEKLKVEAELRKYSGPTFKGCYYIYMKSENGALGLGVNRHYKSQGTIYFESAEKAQQAIETVGEERIKKYIFGVED